MKATATDGGAARLVPKIIKPLRRRVMVSEGEEPATYPPGGLAYRADEGVGGGEEDTVDLSEQEDEPRL